MLLTIAVMSETVVPHKVAMFSISTGFPWNTDRSSISPLRRVAWKLCKVLPADIEENKRLEVATTEEIIDMKQRNLNGCMMRASGCCLPPL